MGRAARLRAPRGGGAALAGLLAACLIGIGVDQAAALPDDRGYELVSPVDKNAGGIAPPSEAGAGSTRAAAQGGGIAFTSKASFANGAGASPYSQYTSRRTSTGWVTENITPAQIAGAYEGSPYLAFSADLGKGLMRKPLRSADCDPCPPGYLVRNNTTGQIIEELDDPSEFEPSPLGPSFRLDAGHLIREVGGVPTDLTSSGGVDALLASDPAADTAYYRKGATIWRWSQGPGHTQILAATLAGTLADVGPEGSGTAAGANRLYFTTKAKLLAADVVVSPSGGAGIPDVYEWRAQGTGGCATSAGCISLISAGKAQAVESSGGFSEFGALFIGASADGTDAFFLTDVSLVDADPGALDLYSARIGGGFPGPKASFPCDGDSCQIMPPEPLNPILTTLLSGPGNPKEQYRTYGVGKASTCPKGKRAKVVRTKAGKRVRRCLAPRQIRTLARKAKRGGRR